MRDSPSPDTSPVETGSLGPDSETKRKNGSYRTRPIRACTNCRQQKIKCNASETYPQPCSRCTRMKRECRVDPHYKVTKNTQMQHLKHDLVALRQQVETLQHRESMLVSAMAKTEPDNPLITGSVSPYPGNASLNTNGSTVVAETRTRHPSQSLATNIRSSGPVPISSPSSSQTPEPPHRMNMTLSDVRTTLGPENPFKYSVNGNNSSKLKGIPVHQKLPHIMPSIRRTSSSPMGSSANVPSPLGSSPPYSIPESDGFVIDKVYLPKVRADDLHRKFMTDYLPYLPIIESHSASELYRQSELLFWAVCLTASLSEPEPSLYYSLCEPIKRLAIETCWMQTPRSVHVVQALLILGQWPLPNEKVLDDCSYRFVNLAKSVGMQLGLHRGKFLYEFSRTQTSIPDAEKWRTRTWLSIYFLEQVYSASLGLPPNIPVDFLVDNATRDESLPRSFRSLLTLSISYSNVAMLMGSSVTAPDGLLDAKSRIATLNLLEQELDRSARALGIIDGGDPSVELYYLYIKLVICIFAFLPGTTTQDQAKYVVTAFHTATRAVTVISGLVEKRRLIEYPIYMRQAVSSAALILFRIHLPPVQLPQQYVESARQSVVTVHRLYRNMVTAWKDLDNDISRTAKVLENLNFVLITHPYLLTESPGIISRMRSHLAASIFYELIWAVHEARRRGRNPEQQVQAQDKEVPQPLKGPNAPSAQNIQSVPPLPFYNQISRDLFTLHTSTSPNGTSTTTLVPAHPEAANVFSSHSGAAGNGRSPGRNIGQQITGNNNSPNDPKIQSLNELSSPVTAILGSTGASNDPLHLDALMQGIDWMSEKGDDFLGWMDMTNSPF